MPRVPGAPRGGKSHQRKVRRELKYALAAANPVLWACVYNLFIRPIEQARHQNYISKKRAALKRNFAGDQVSSSNQAASSSRETDVGESVESSAGPEVVEIVEIEDDESEQNQSSESIAPVQLPDLSSVRQLREISDQVQQCTLNLPVHCPGIALFNKLAFADSETGDEISGELDWNLLKESIKGCVVLDIFKTVIFPRKYLSRQADFIALAQHRNELQTIDRRTVTFLERLRTSGYIPVAISYIGRGGSSDYLRALRESCLVALKTVILICFRREDKAELARLLESPIAFDDQREVCGYYKRAGIYAAQVTRDWSLHENGDEALELIEWRFSQSEGKSKGVSRVVLRDSRQ